MESDASVITNREKSNVLYIKFRDRDDGTVYIEPFSSFKHRIVDGVNHIYVNDKLIVCSRSNNYDHYLSNIEAALINGQKYLILN